MNAYEWRADVRLSSFLLVAVLTTACQSNNAPATAPIPEEDRVHVGYGIVDRDNVTGSVASMSEEEIERARVSRVEELFNGHIAGVRMIQTPAGPSLRVRGAATFAGSEEPLLVMDGVPINMSNGMFLSSLNPSNIARIEVLKDAGAAAIYGSRAANGVVLITTKRARPRE
jgi:TonB-dependent SusC/RagA subfamily outer membrane receptor